MLRSLLGLVVVGLPLALGLCVLPAARAQSDSGAAVVLARLRADVKAHHDSFPLVFALGKALARSTTERSTGWRQRVEAKKYLEQAMRMRDDDPRPLLEMGMLLRKQGFRPDAVRLMRMAEGRAGTAGLVLPPEDLAEMHYQMALAYETWWEDAEHLGELNSDFSIGSCSQILWPQSAELAWGRFSSLPRANLLLYNYYCPDVFDELMANWQPLDIYEADHASMVLHFKEALRLDPMRTDAAFRLMRHLVAADSWEEYTEVVEQLARRRPDDPNVLLYLGLGYHLTGRQEGADSAFTLALERATPALRHDLLEPAQLLRSHDSVTFLALNEEKRALLGDVFWRARDPLFLTPGNERLAEHLARLAYVDVAYGTPQSGIAGRWTDRGAAWLRYGRPIQIRVVRGSGLLEFWDYGAGSPDLVFTRQRTYRWARNEDMSEEYLRNVRERVPEVYAPEYPRFVAGIPFQAAVFRDSTGGAVLEVYGGLPTEELRRATDAPQIETGVFVVTGDLWEPRAALRQTRALTDADTLLDARVPLEPGSYVVSLEAVAWNVAAQRRQRVDVRKFDSTLALSDLLLVDRFDAEDAAGDDRAALAPVVSHTSLFRTDAPIGVLWEIYGLRTDSTGVARYRIRAELANERHEIVLIQGLRALIEGRHENRVEWDVGRVPRGDGAVVEHVRLELPGLKAGSYRVFITVTDLLTGQSFTAHRPIAVTKPPP